MTFWQKDEEMEQYIAGTDTDFADEIEPQFLSRRQAVAYLQKKYGSPGSIAYGTLAKLACIGGGPVFVKFGYRVGYTKKALDEWQASRRSGPLMSTSGIKVK